MKTPSDSRAQELTRSPPPRPGDVIRYAFLWPDAHDHGRDSDKDRPCAVVVAAAAGDEHVVYVVPVTTRDPKDRRAIELTPGGLPGLTAQCWIVPWVVNFFVWMGPDVGRAPDPRGAFWRYGALSPALRNRLADRIQDEIREGRRWRAIPRSE